MFKCELCGKYFKIINGYHLKQKHDITIDDYRNMFPHSNLGFSKRRIQIRKTCLDKYGVENISQLEEIKEKKQDTCLNNYGVHVPAKSEVIKVKMKQTSLQNYGVDNPSKSEVVKDKFKKTMLIRYGVDNPLKYEVIKEKVHQTMIDRYGSKTYKESEEYLYRYIKKHSFLFTVEEYRIIDGKIQVHCKNHNCSNSKEQGGWFTPSGYQLKDRRRALEDEKGNDGAYLYCSQNCKYMCPLYNLKSDPFKNIEIPYIEDEYSVWTKVVLEQDNYTCQKCGSKENLHCHHIIPVKIEPMFALDPDNGIILCGDCHYKYGHKTGTECSTGNLANKKCFNVEGK